ncbi:hypothetical protein GCM10010468_14710 [Actinocorallia longicatena]|uniref:D-alanyl-D-alanine carboxypeptidase-like core domain-containing protein n=1 Tax=Actinocorallia longicatena TaxID=111803 RepID=A0ABP6Q5U4_9ACTN
MRLSAVALATLALVVCGAPPGAVALAPGTDKVEELRRQANKARDDLDKLDKDLKEQIHKSSAAREKLKDTVSKLTLADAEYEKLRGPLAQLAGSSYMTPTSSGSLALFGSADPEDALRAASDVSHLADAKERLLKTAGDLRQRREDLVNEQQNLQSQTALGAAKVSKQRKIVFARINQITDKLNQMLKRLDLDRDTRLTLQCDTSLAKEATQFPNGLIPSKYLCKLPQKPFLLRADAALTFYKLNTAYRKRFGKDICLRDAYRDLKEQQRLYYTRPGFAAVPGRSNHGLGQAIDMCGGIENQGSLQFNWMRANSLTYGWFHPSWAYSSPFEPWHWEFGTGEKASQD